jgi:3',5'-nucleoside bisphosphate phosphatase
MQMNILKTFSTIVLVVAFSFQVDAQRREISVPDIPGYRTLKCDFHTHTVFSDGLVWPTYRVGEAWRDGLDVLAITDHYEYTPFSDDVNVDTGRPYELVKDLASRHGLLLVQGAEITRTMPPGHFNAIFLEDPERLRLADVSDVIAEALRQDAYIFWNHPGWRGQQPDGVVRVYDIHREWFEKEWVHGVEFGNDQEYYPAVIDIARDYNLGLLANSDIHGTTLDTYTRETDLHRPLTLVFSREKSIPALREAMFAGRTVAWIQNTLAGSEQWLRPLLLESLEIDPPNMITEESKWVTIRNVSAFFIHLEKADDGGGPNLLRLDPLTSLIVAFPKDADSIRYEVINTITLESGVPIQIDLEMPMPSGD